MLRQDDFVEIIKEAFPQMLEDAIVGESYQHGARSETNIVACVPLKMSLLPLELDMTRSCRLRKSKNISKKV